MLRVKSVANFKTEEIVKFHNQLAKAFRVNFVNSSILQLWYNRFFEKLQDTFFVKYGKDFSGETLKSFEKIRPLCIGKKILLPYKIGCESVPAANQISTAIHEVTHAVRISSYPGSPTDWYYEYFSNAKFRALEETSAFEETGEFDFWQNGVFPEFSRSRLSRYFVDGQSMDLSESAYNLRRTNCVRLGRLRRIGTVAKKSVEIARDLGVTPK